LTGRSRSPSWNSSVAFGQTLAGTVPPMSEEWMKAYPYATIRPRQKIGLKRWMSGRWVQSPPVVYGSLQMTMSPSS
jgi:hypothetical protein